jgi:NCS2 family nucleobase:cation symporter-2
MSRHVVTIGAIFLIIAGLVPKVGAVIRTIPIEVLGGVLGLIVGLVQALVENLCLRGVAMAYYKSLL